MGILSNFVNIFTGPTEGILKNVDSAIVAGDAGNYLLFPPGYGFEDAYAENISTIYTSCKILADDVGSFPIDLLFTEDGAREKLKSDYRYSLLHYNPNSYTTSNVFFTTLEYIRNVKGNAFAKINIGKNREKYLTLVTPGKIYDWTVENGILMYKYRENSNDPGYNVLATDYLHFRSMTKDGVWGMNPIEKLRLNLSTTSKAFKTIDTFYDNNATSPKALKTTVPEGVNPKEWQNKIADFNNKYTGAQNAGKIITLPPFTELQDITLNFADAEFIATIRFNADQIASLYRIPPHLVGNFESSKFNNLEQLQLNYKINTIRPILRMYRQELESKLLTPEERLEGISIEFNTNAIVETDSKTRIENTKSLFGMGAITPNDICKLEGQPTYKGGDQHFILTQLMSVEAYNQKNKKELNNMFPEEKTEDI